MLQSANMTLPLFQSYRQWMLSSDGRNNRASFLEDDMPKWMTKCERCGDVVAGECVTYINRKGQVEGSYHIQCFITASLAPSQLPGTVSTTWGGRAPRYEPDPNQSRCNCALVEEPGTPGKRAILVEDFDSKRWE